jgi:hypothetical protein
MDTPEGARKMYIFGLLLLIVLGFAIAVAIWIGHVSGTNNPDITQLQLLKDQIQELQSKQASIQQELSELQNQKISIIETITTPENHNEPDLNETLTTQATQIAELQKQVDDHLTAGGVTEPARVLDSIVNTLDWKINVKPCSEFGAQDDPNIMDGITTLVMWQGSDWEHSQCLDNLVGWDPKDTETKAYIVLLKSTEYTSMCAYTEMDYNVLVWSPPSMKEPIPEELLGTNDSDLVTKLTLLTRSIPSIGVLKQICSSGKAVNEAISVPIRVWPLSEEDAYKLSLSMIIVDSMP